MSRFNIQIGSLVRLGNNGKNYVPLYDNVYVDGHGGEAYIGPGDVGLVLDKNLNTEWGQQVLLVTSSGNSGWASLDCFEEVK